MPEPVTLEQANAALKQLVSRDPAPDPEPESASPAPELSAAQEDTPSDAAEPALVDSPSSDAAPIEEPGDDDVASLKQRLTAAETERQKERERYEARLKAHQERSTANQRILHDKFLRKATAADRALKVLKATRTPDGVPEGEVDETIRFVEGTMHPASPSYAPAAPPSPDAEDKAIVLNDFLNEKHMSIEEAAEFGKWLTSDGATALTPQEQGVARDSVDGFLRIAHGRWQESVRQDQESKRNAAVGAVRSIQRTQRDAARAASVTPTAPRKQPTPQRAEMDTSKFSKDDISKLLRKSVEEAKRAEV